jgi:prevent-host-death family protein
MKKRRKTVPASPKQPNNSGLRRLATWKLEEAKALFSEVVRLAATKGPQLVTIRGKEAAVILSAVEFERLLPTEKRKPLVDLYLSILTFADYEKGIHHLSETDSRRPRLRTAVASLEARFQNRVLPLTNAVVRRGGVISGEIKRATRHAPNVIDTMLAATAIENGLYLVTRNTQDVLRSGAMLFNPWQDDPSAFPILL